MNLIVTRVSEKPHHAEAAWGAYRFPAAIGRSGVIAADQKREGDGFTPAGCYSLLEVYYRADRATKPTGLIPGRAITPQDGYCDDPASPDYNQPVVLPYPLSHEVLWRTDRCYDLCVRTSHNLNPTKAGYGSCIFLHLARPDYSPTAGCVAVALPALQRILRDWQPHSMLEIRG